MNNYKQSRLSNGDKKFLVKGVGVFRDNAVSPEIYNASFFSSDHVAYKEGYSLATRLKKYSDAINNIKRYLTQPIIDLGCGPGYIVEGLRRLGVMVKGVDVSKEAVEEIAPTSVRKLLCQSSLTKLPFNDGEYNSGYSFHVLEHLTIGEIESSILEISRVVKHQLYLIIPVWDRLPSLSLFNQIMSDPTHRVIATRNWWVHQFSVYGWIQNQEMEHKLDRLNRGWVFFFQR